MYKNLFATLLVVCIGLFSVSFASTANYSALDSFLSPLAESSLRQTGDIAVSADVKTMSKNVEQNVKTIAYGRSTGCSSGCSMGCSSGCSSGCSMGCSSGCSSGCGGW